MRGLKLAGSVAIFAIPALIYALIATKGSMNFFYPEYGWVFYNQYAIAISQGRLWVPAEAIGPEGLYVGGHVYAYYGVLPALLRLPLLPFIDFRTTPIAVLMNWAMSVGGVAALQLAAFDALRWRRARGAAPAAGWIFGLASLSLWFFSGAFLVVQNASFYHEPFAASLLASGLFTWISVRVLLFQAALPTRTQLVALAVLAGLTLFARQTTAISLYAGVLVWLALAARHFVLAEGFSPGRAVRWTATQAIAPLAILGMAGLIYLGLNIVRFGGGNNFPMDDYGVMLMRPHDARLLSIHHQGQFHWARIVPNMIFALIGGDEFRQRLITMMGGGATAAMGAVIRLAFAWTPAFLLSFLSLGWLGRRVRTDPTALAAVLLLGCLSIGAGLQLAYATVQYRYHADIWPPIAFLVVLSIAAAPEAGFRTGTGRLVSSLAAACLAISTIYVATLIYRTPSDVAHTMNEPLPEVLIKRATAPGSRDPYLPGGTPLPRPAPPAAVADKPPRP